MTKETIIKNAVSLIEEYAKNMNLTINNKGTGHAFDHSLWDFEDTSGIPEIIAYNDNFNITLRSFWGDPEIDIRQQNDLGEELLVITFSDYIKKGKEYIHTDNYVINQIRIDGCRGDYEASLKKIYKIIGKIYKNVKEN